MKTDTALIIAHIYIAANMIVGKPKVSLIAMMLCSFWLIAIAHYKGRKKDEQ